MKELYLYIRKLSFTAFLTIHTVLWSLLGWLLLTVIKALGKTVWFSPYEELAQRFVLGFPVISQTVLCFIVFLRHRKLVFYKILFPLCVGFMLLCGALCLYELYYTLPDFGDKLLIAEVYAQGLFQLALAFLLLICLVAGKVKRQTAVVPLLMPFISMAAYVLLPFLMSYYLMLLFLLINLYNPVLLYILNATARGELFVEDTPTYEQAIEVQE